MPREENDMPPPMLPTPAKVRWLTTNVTTESAGTA